MRTDTLVLPNCDFDSGKPTKAAEYSLTDDTYAELLAQLVRAEIRPDSPDLRANLLDFYSDLSVPIITKTNPGDWQSVLTALDELKSLAPAPMVAGRPGQ